MGVSAGPDLSESGLVLALDGANYKSFKGEATTNLIPSPTINAYPTTGNGWGTYNTNQYGSGNYFSIGSISSVSNNIITTSGNHPLRTYDVVRPQTTGGGVTAEVDYFVKKLSNTTFTLHAYNGSQDGSQGYINSSTGTHKVYDSIATDTRISVNSTNFPTMWWGYPHLPNSGLVKELRYGEFNAIANLPVNDCIRLHYIRTDDVKDGMSYGVDCTVTAGSPVTVSFYTRAANTNAVGKVIQYYIYNYGASATAYAWNFTLGAAGIWERQSFTYTPAYGTMISYWFPQSGGVYAWDWSCMQVEQKSYSTSFVAGTRGTTVATGGGWADLTGRGNNGELVNGVKESGDNLGSVSFDGTNDYIDVNSNFGTVSQYTISFWARRDAENRMLICSRGSTNFYWYGDNSWRYVHSGGGGEYYYTKPTSIPVGTWGNYVVTYDGSAVKIYRQGVYQGQQSTTGTADFSSGFTFGTWNNNGGYYFSGLASLFQIYNRALTAAEIQQNFNATRGRFGI